MEFNELQKAYFEKGYEFIKGGGDGNFVLIPLKKPHSFWTSFENYKDAERALPIINKPTETPTQNYIHIPEKTKKIFLSLKEEIKYCFTENNIDALVYGAKPGEHHVKIQSTRDLNGIIFDSGCHKIRIAKYTDICGNKFYIGGRVR